MKSAVERDPAPIAAPTQKHGQASTRAEVARTAENGMGFASALARTSGSTLVDLMMGLQRQAGNQAVGSLVTASKTSPASVQRAAPIDDDRHLSAPLLSSHPRLDQAFHNNPPLGPTDERDDLAAFQAALAQVIGPLPGSFNPATRTFDGRWGRETVAAVRRYQADRGILPGGQEAGRLTLGALDADLRGGVKPVPKPIHVDPYEPGEREFSASSPGKFEKTPDGIVLFGFPINKQFLKPEHRAFLKQLVSDFDLANPNTVTPLIEIVGFTDSVRRTAGNAELREDRADAVFLFLATQRGDEKVLGSERGAPLDQSLASNDTRAGRERNRAVRIKADAILPEPPPPKLLPIPDPPGTSRAWSLEAENQLSPPVDPGIAITIGTFKLRDVTHGSRVFHLLFVGAGPGLSIAFPASKAIPSQTPFKTRSAARPGDFSGGGAIFAVNVGPGTPAARAALPPHTDPEAIDISGWNVGLALGVSLVAGRWQLLP